MFNKNFGMQNFGMQGQGCCPRQMTSPIVEPTMTKCVQKDFYHEVPQE